MFRPLEANIRSRFGYPGGGIKFKVANGTGTRTVKFKVANGTGTRTVSHLKLNSASWIPES